MKRSLFYALFLLLAVAIVWPRDIAIRKEVAALTLMDDYSAWLRYYAAKLETARAGEDDPGPEFFEVVEDMRFELALHDVRTCAFVQDCLSIPDDELPGDGMTFREVDRAIQALRSSATEERESLRRQIGRLADRLDTLPGKQRLEHVRELARPGSPFAEKGWARSVLPPELRPDVGG